MKRQILVARAATTMVSVACPMVYADASAVGTGFSPNGRVGWRNVVPPGSAVFA
ncbi:hypothetical protein [Paraburkholderia oxyphila]|uniref:hypothetical protein n=1 Tax=Paraburkholderia oxyphila TaxID=614212 RepID=UPI000AF37D49|nr:hypothetical protein [Paraburkholderia oxyphila]